MWRYFCHCAVDFCHYCIYNRNRLVNRANSPIQKITLSSYPCKYACTLCNKEVVPREGDCLFFYFPAKTPHCGYYGGFSHRQPCGTQKLPLEFRKNQVIYNESPQLQKLH